MTNEERRQLDEQGFVVLEDCMGDDLLRDLREQIHHVSDAERGRAGHEFRTEAHAHRLANLVDKGEVFRRAIVLPRVIGGRWGVRRYAPPGYSCGSGRLGSWAWGVPFCWGL